MQRKQTIIFFLMAAGLITCPSMAFGFSGPGGNYNTLLESVSLSGGENNNNVVTAQLSGGTSDSTFQVLPDPSPPSISDPNVRVEKVISGLDSPTSMAFLDNDDIIITQKDDGKVRLVSNGVLQPQPILQVPVVNNSERGLLGVAIANTTDSTTKYVYLDYTEPVEIKRKTGSTDTTGAGQATWLEGALFSICPANQAPTTMAVS